MKSADYPVVMVNFTVGPNNSLNPLKPSKYGILIKSLGDSEYPYVYRLQFFY